MKELLFEARRLDRAREYPALAALLRPWDRIALAGEPELLFLPADEDFPEFGNKEPALFR